MTVPSNLYAEKVFAEQPIGLWALDDQADYISFITPTQRNMQSYWTVSLGSASTSTIDLNQPFENSTMSLISGNVPSVSSQNIDCVSPNLVNLNDLNADLESISIGAYIYSNSVYLNSISIGYEYTDTTTSLVVKKLETYQLASNQKWIFISATLPLVSQSTNLRAVIRFNVKNGGSTSSDYQFYVNGVTVGQWSEEFNATSLGVTPISLPSNISINTGAIKGIEADQYGIGGNVGYYIIDDNKLLAKNTSIPIVYGASTITKLFPSSSNLPSLIVPGNGFLNKSGKNKDYTVEFWLRVNSGTLTPKRIFGPVGSLDGLYVESGYLTLVIGNNFGSHFVGKWYRPMLIDIRLINNSVSVLVNGEECISFSIDTNNLSLPDILDNYDKNQDWLGFYTYSDVAPVEIDCIAIYSYPVPISVAKRRWVYGQAVGSPEVINGAYGGTSALIDYSFADYTSDYIYPDFARWDQATFDNLLTDSLYLSTPVYELPEIFLSTKTLNQLYEDNKAIQVSGDKFVTFRPNSTWDTIYCYFNFPRFNILGDQISSIYGVFESDDLVTEETLFKIYNEVTGNYFSIRKDADEIHYYLTFDGIEEEIYTTDIIETNEKYAAGIKIDSLVQSFGGNVAAFFGNQNGFKMYVGGDESGQNQFTGKIYSIGISTPYNTNQISDHFLDNGTVKLDSYLATGSEISANANALLAHTASYTLLPNESYDIYFLDIGVSGYWEDYMPLSYFAQYVKDSTGEEYYDVDFIQFNIGYPKPISPVGTEYNTDNALVKSYITFQYIEEGANEPQESFTIDVKPQSDLIVNVDSYTNWISTRFEVLDGTIIYPTKTVDFNDLAVVYYLDFNVRSTISKQVFLRKLELSSQALSNNNSNKVGTRFGVSLIPYTRSGLYYDYKAKNPFCIYKESTPYLYLTKDSGIEVRGSQQFLTNRGLALPINSNEASLYSVSSIQMWMFYDNAEFPLVETELFEVQYKTDTIVFYLIADENTSLRANIYAKSKNTGEEIGGLNYYLNGSIVKFPVLNIKEWTALGVLFPSPLDLSFATGYINLNGPFIFDNISYYQANNLQQTQNTITRAWLAVKNDGVLVLDWDYWRDSFTWRGMLVLSDSQTYGVSPKEVYNSYIGINKIIVDDNLGVSVNSDIYNIYSGSSWSSLVKTPV